MQLPATAKLLQMEIDKSSALRDIDVLLVQHLFEDTLAFISILLDVNISVRAVIGIPYSAKKPVVHALENLGVDTLVPDIDKIPDVVLRHVEQGLRVGRQVIVHEVGGYCAPLAGNNLTFQQGCLGVVEETKQGLWRYAALPKLMIPVVQFADCKLKILESEFVGRAIVRSIDEDLAVLGKSVETADIGVIGFGDIGSGVGRSLHQRGARVWCFDKRPIRMMEAAARGFICADLKRLLGACNAIVGATGVGCIDETLLPTIRNGALLCSASSRNIEFPIDAIQKSSVSNSTLTSHVTEYAFAWGKRLCVSSDGFPVNFRSLSLPPSFGDLMFSQVVKGFTGVLNRSYTIGLHRLSEADQETIAEAWWDCYREQSGIYGSIT